MTTLSEQSKDTASGLLSTLSSNVKGAESFSDTTPNSVILEGIYKLMVKNTAEDKMWDELEDDKNDSRNFLADKRHDEIIDALSYTGKFKKPELKKQKQEPKNKKDKKDNLIKSNKKTTSTKQKTVAQNNKPEKVSKQKKEPPVKQNTVEKKPQTPTPVSGTPSVPSIGKVATAAVTIGVSTAAISKIKSKEGYSEKAYYDPKKGSTNKFYSVGHGHQITDEEVKQGFISVGDKKVPVKGDRGRDTVISKTDAESLLKIDYQKYENYAKSLPNFDKLNIDAQIALVDMTYNMGVGWASTWPILRQQLQNMDLNGVADNILSSRKTGGYAAQVGKRADENAESIRKGAKATNTTNATANMVGTNIDASSKENQQLNQELNTPSTPSSTVNQTNVNVTQQQQQNNPTVSGNDNSAYERKSRTK